MGAVLAACGSRAVANAAVESLTRVAWASKTRDQSLIVVFFTLEPELREKHLVLMKLSAATFQR